MSLELTVEKACLHFISGWARYTPGDGKVVLHFYDVNHNLLASQPADIFRQDLVNAGIGDGRFGFRVEIAPPERVHTITAELLPSFDYPDIEKHKIHKDDYIFSYVCEYFYGQDVLALYNQTGKMSADKLKTLCKDILKIEKNTISLLEFASGYGCVTRHFDTGLFDVTSCDIHEEAVRFVGENFHVATLLSKMNPEDFMVQAPFDVVFALSFFSHMHDVNFGKWLKALYAAVAPGGYLIFTTHGLVSNERYDMKLEGDFIFHKSSEQKDLDPEYYGVTVCTEKYVTQKCKEFLGVAPDFFFEGEWWEHQDLYIVKKSD